MRPRPRRRESRASGRSSSTARRSPRRPGLRRRPSRSASAPGSPGRSPGARSCSPSRRSTSTRCRAGASASASAPGSSASTRRWHGVEYGRPAPHLRETVEATRLIMESANAGAPIRYEGDYHDIDIKGWTRPHPAIREKVPIYVAAVGEGMARMAGDVADGALGHLICSTALARRGDDPELREGACALGPRALELRLHPGHVRCDRERRLGGRGAYEAARKTLAFYATVRTYAHVFELDGFGSHAEAVGNAFRAGDLAGVAAAVTDEMVDAYCAVGTIDRVREKVGEVAALGDSISLGPPTYFIPPEEIAEYQRRVLEAFGPANRSSEPSAGLEGVLPPGSEARPVEGPAASRIPPRAQPTPEGALRLPRISPCPAPASALGRPPPRPRARAQRSNRRAPGCSTRRTSSRRRWSGRRAASSRASPPSVPAAARPTPSSRRSPGRGGARRRARGSPWRDDVSLRPAIPRGDPRTRPG